MPPVVATRVSHGPPREGGAYSRLFPVERAFVHGLRKRERYEIADALEASSRKRGREETPLRIQVLRSRLPDEVKDRLFDDLGRSSCEKLTTWARKAVRLPLGVSARRAPAPSRSQAVSFARFTMDAAVTACEAAKREVLRLVAEEGCEGGRYPLGFEGPPGTGKTHFVRNALAPALQKPMVSIPLGGARDVGFLFGNLYVYEGSKEGALAAALVEAGCDDPIIYFDEVDKVSTTDKGMELMNALIHLVDPTANMALRDHYFHGIDIDFSRCTFVFSYNDPSRVSPVLLDRIRRVAMPAPTAAERRSIVLDHILPRARRRVPATPPLSPEAEATLLAACSPDEKGGERDGVGMRGAERLAQGLLSGAHLCVVAEEETGTLVGAADVRVLDAEGRISGSFAVRLLSGARADEAGRLAPPPDGMYT